MATKREFEPKPFDLEKLLRGVNLSSLDSMTDTSQGIPGKSSFEELLSTIPEFEHTFLKKLKLQFNHPGTKDFFTVPRIAVNDPSLKSEPLFICEKIRTVFFNTLLKRVIITYTRDCGLVDQKRFLFGGPASVDALCFNWRTKEFHQVNISEDNLTKLAYMLD